MKTLLDFRNYLNQFPEEKLNTPIKVVTDNGNVWSSENDEVRVFEMPDLMMNLENYNALSLDAWTAEIAYLKENGNHLEAESVEKWTLLKGGYIVIQIW